MNTVKFIDACPVGVKLKYSVIAAQYRGKWIFCRHKARTTWEIPGGHIEPGETSDQAAFRELWEETGAVKADIIPVSIYAFNDYGVLYFAEVTELGPIPDHSEIEEIELFDQLPDNLTYPHIQPYLYEKVAMWLTQK